MPPRTSAAVLGLAVLLAGVAAALLLVTPAAGGPTPLPWWALALGYAAAEAVVVHLQVRRQTVSVSFGELAIVAGLAFSAPAEHLLASVVGSGAVLLLQRRQGAVKLAFNLALFALECSVVLAVHGALAGDGGPASAQAALATLAAVVVGDLVSAVAVTLVLVLVSGRVDREPLVEAGTTGLVTAVANGGLALLLVAMLVELPWGLVPLGALAAVLLVLQRANADLERGQSRTQLLYGFLRATSAGPPVRELVARVLEDARDALQAGHAELSVRDGGGTWHRFRLGEGSGVEGPLAGSDPGPLPRPVRGDGRLVVPLRAEGVLAGVLAVHGRPAHLPALGEDEESLLQSLADHAAVALAHADSLERLRVEVTDRVHRARHDAVTGLLNREGLLERLEQVEGEPLVLALQLTSLDAVCAALGAEVGDSLLRAVAERLAAEAPGDCARVGSDLFAVLLHGHDGPGAEEVLGRAGEPVLLDGFSLPAPARAGCARRERGLPSAVALQRAVTALRSPRHRGGVEPWSAEQEAGSARRLRLVADLRTAVLQDRLEVHYQPKVAAADGRPLGVEALVRWRHEELGPVGPDEFVPLAERSGLVDALTDLVLRTALRDAAAWQERWPGLGLAVNLSVSSLADPALPGRVAAALRASGLPPERLTLEVTESGVMDDLEACLACLAELRALGVQLSVDDFGTGHSSLAYLKDLPVQELKIDRSFVRDLGTGPGAAVLQSAVRLGHALGLRVVAEGVEDAPTAAVLHEWGCDVLQGWAFCRALPRPELEAWLAQREPLSRVPAPRGLLRSEQQQPVRRAEAPPRGVDALP